MGILEGSRVVEFGGLGPASWTCTFLTDMGAEVVRIDRPGSLEDYAEATWMQGRQRLQLNLKDEGERRVVEAMMDAADIVVDPYRPGVLERLGLGPDGACERNPRLVYGRLTGWGQTGPWAHRAGHDLNYLSITGAVSTLGDSTTPIPSLYYIGDWGAGTMLLLSGILGALFERERSGRGQVVDAAIVDGASLMMMQIMDWQASAQWRSTRGVNEIDGGSWYYSIYATSDGGHMAVGAYEPVFRERVLQTLGIEPTEARVLDPAMWVEVRGEVEKVFARRSRSEWEAVFETVDACVTPVRRLEEAHSDPHLLGRGIYGVHGGRARPAPRFSRTPSTQKSPQPTFDPVAWGVGVSASEMQQ